MKEMVGYGGSKKGGPDGTGVKPGLSVNMGVAITMDGYDDGMVHDDNAMNSGRNGFNRAVKEETHSSVGGGFTINGKP